MATQRLETTWHYQEMLQWIKADRQTKAHHKFYVVLIWAKPSTSTRATDETSHTLLTGHTGSCSSGNLLSACFSFFLPFHLYHLRSCLESWYGQGSNKSQFMFSGYKIIYITIFLFVLLTLRPQTFQQHTLRVDEKQSESLTFCIVLNEQRHWVFLFTIIV